VKGVPDVSTNSGVSRNEVPERQKVSGQPENGIPVGRENVEEHHQRVDVQQCL